MTRITGIQARPILDSRGWPTIEVDAYLDCGVMGRAAVPSGNDALELRDGDPKRYLGKGVSKAVTNVNTTIAQELLGMDAVEQRAIDSLMGTINAAESKPGLGANAILAVSLAVAKSAALGLDLPLFKYIGGVNAYTLPVPMINLLDGSNAPDFGSFMAMPTGAKSFKQALRMGTEVFHALKALLKQKGWPATVSDQGGFAPGLPSNTAAIEIVLKAIKAAGYKSGSDIVIALDPHAGAFYKSRGYRLDAQDTSSKSPAQMAQFWADWVAKYPIISIEDGMAPTDWAGWKKLTDSLGDQIQLAGGDLFHTNVARLKKGMVKGVANAILVKINQVSTLSEILDTLQMAHRAGYATIVSHSSGETEDTTIADIAVATNASQIKAGSVTRSERVAKYNQLLRIEEELGAEARFPGADLAF